MKIAVIGSQGVPANYGGFESLVENLIGENCPTNVEYTIFCSSKDMPDRRKEYKGATLKYVGLHANGAQSVIYDMASMCLAMRGYDVILILGVSGCLFIPVLRLFCRSKIIVNIDGLEHRRAKWGKMAKWILKLSEALAVKYSDIVVADNQGIQDYVSETYNHPSQLIAYGGDHVKRDISENFIAETLTQYSLNRGKYAITVCRIEPENNSHIILKAFSKSEIPLVFIGNWNHSDYSRSLKNEYQGFENIKLIDAIYNLDILYALRSNAGIYIHGHSAGGTNPSLVEAMFFGIPIIAYDVVYNRETTENKAYYFKSAGDIQSHLSSPSLSGEIMAEIAMRRYTWKHISAQYCKLYPI